MKPPRQGRKGAPEQTGLVPIGQVGFLKDLLDQAPKILKPPAPSKATDKLIDTAVEIRQDAPEDDDIAFLAREFIQCTLPHSNPGNLPGWGRTNGWLGVGIVPGFDFIKNKSIGFPYGSLPRLLLFWMNTEAVRKGSRRLEMGSSFAEFVRALGLDPSRGGSRSDHVRLKNQMQRLFAATISFQSKLENKGLVGEHRVNLEVTKTSQLWWDPKSPDQISLFGSWIELGEAFFELVTAAPVPVDVRALRALKRSPLALDLYAWSTHKALAVARKGKSQFVPWRGLMTQFGADYTDHHNFKKKAQDALRKIQAVYPGLKLSDATGGLIVLPTSRPAVPMKPSRRSLT